ncbi:uncharacterized protein DEA37_0002500 [Paragonimus westermani]|uniref:Uncharacterized protein n=1 Tax=Paragonimus westermani TaxID=34504 RepID=A0A5J4NXG4_9TREM|nr:uncharacterized protein DEA37_0002500 [Paragonimus westermani]
MSVSPTQNKSQSQPQYTDYLEIINLGSNQPHLSNEGHARLITETNANLLEKVVVTNNTLMAWPIRLSSVCVMEQREQKSQEPEKSPNPVVDPLVEAAIKRPDKAESIPKSTMSMSLQVDGLLSPPMVNIEARVQFKNYLVEYNVPVRNTISPGTKGEICDARTDVPQIRFTCTSPIDTDKTSGPWQVIASSSVGTKTPEDLAGEHAQFDASHSRNHADTQSPSAQHADPNELPTNFISPLDNFRVETKLQCDQREQQPEAKSLVNLSVIPPNDPIQPRMITENDTQQPDMQPVPTSDQMDSGPPFDRASGAPVHDNTVSEPSNIVKNHSVESTDPKQPETHYDEYENVPGTDTSHQNEQAEVNHDYLPGEASESQAKSKCFTSYENQMELTGGQAVICDEQPQQLIQSYCESVGPNDVRVDKVSVSKEDENLEVKLGHFNSEQSEEAEKLVPGPSDPVTPVTPVNKVEDGPVQNILTTENHADTETSGPTTHTGKHKDMSLVVQPAILPISPETKKEVEHSEVGNEVGNFDTKRSMSATEQGAQSFQSDQRLSIPLHSAINVVDTNPETSTVSRFELREHGAEQFVDDQTHGSTHLVGHDQLIANNPPETKTYNRNQKDDVTQTLANTIQEQEGEVLIGGSKEIKRKDDLMTDHTSGHPPEDHLENLSIELESNKKSDGKSFII